MLGLSPSSSLKCREVGYMLTMFGSGIVSKAMDAEGMHVHHIAIQCARCRYASVKLMMDCHLHRPILLMLFISYTIAGRIRAYQQ